MPWHDNHLLMAILTSGANQRTFCIVITPRHVSYGCVSNLGAPKSMVPRQIGKYIDGRQMDSDIALDIRYNSHLQTEYDKHPATWWVQTIIYTRYWCLKPASTEHPRRREMENCDTWSHPQEVFLYVPMVDPIDTHRMVVFHPILSNDKSQNVGHSARQVNNESPARVRFLDEWGLMVV